MSREPGTPIRVKVLVPTHEKVDALFAYDLAQMMALTAAVMPPDEGHELGLEMNIGTYIHKSRTELLQVALEEGATHVLWLDSDMRFPPDTFLRLLQHEVPIVGINYSKRRVPPGFVAIKRVPREGDDPTDGEFLHTNDDSEGLEEVDVLGFGAVLMDTSTLANLPDPKYDPWFWFGKTEHGAEIGEDAWFCLKMLQERCGQRIFVDHDLSKQCAHLGQFEYKCYHAQDAMELAQEG